MEPIELYIVNEVTRQPAASYLVNCMHDGNIVTIVKVEYLQNKLITTVKNFKKKF
jgi:hypothetical protein